MICQGMSGRWLKRMICLFTFALTFTRIIVDPAMLCYTNVTTSSLLSMFEEQVSGLPYI